MMKVLNLGSMNIDHVYRVDHMVRAGETLNSEDMRVFYGGKGLNQSIAMAKAGIEVFHAGCVGEDGGALLDTLREYNVDTAYVKICKEKSGHTIIQVDKEGQNCILLYGGSNRSLEKTYIDETLENFSAGDLLVLQNEVNLLDYIVDAAYAKNMQIALNPSPIDEKLFECDLEKVSIFFLNEIEGKAIVGAEQPEDILDRMRERYPNSRVVLTLGEEGSWYADREQRFHCDCVKTNVVDTTGAGDTFLGYFIYGYLNGLLPQETMRLCARAAAITVSRPGAAASIPLLRELL